jgi:hypothetical protein
MRNGIDLNPVDIVIYLLYREKSGIGIFQISDITCTICSNQRKILKDMCHNFITGVSLGVEPGISLITRILIKILQRNFNSSTSVS